MTEDEPKSSTLEKFASMSEDERATVQAALSNDDRSSVKKIAEAKEGRSLSTKEMEAAIQGLADSGRLEFKTVDQLKHNKVDLDYLHVLKQVMSIIQQTPEGETPYVIFPIEEPLDTKKNKVYLDKDDRESPTGMVVKKDPWAKYKYAPNAAAKFDAYEVMAWIAVRMEDDPNLDEDALEELAGTLKGEDQDDG